MQLYTIICPAQLSVRPVEHTNPGDFNDDIGALMSCCRPEAAVEVGAGFRDEPTQHSGRLGRQARRVRYLSSHLIPSAVLQDEMIITVVF